MKTKPQAAQGKPGAGTGIEWAEKRRTIFRAEAPENGPYYRYDPTTGEWKERQPWTAEELAEAAVNSTPVTGRVATELGVKDFNPAGVIGHEDAQGLLLTTGLPRAARTKRFEFNPATGEKHAEVLFADVASIDRAVAAAKRALPAWRDTSLGKRARSRKMAACASRTR